MKSPSPLPLLPPKKVMPIYAPTWTEEKFVLKKSSAMPKKTSRRSTATGTIFPCKKIQTAPGNSPSRSPTSDDMKPKPISAPLIKSSTGLKDATPSSKLNPLKPFQITRFIPPLFVSLVPPAIKTLYNPNTKTPWINSPKQIIPYSLPPAPFATSLNNSTS